MNAKNKEDIFICIVGKNSAPIAKTITHHEPTHVLFICSSDSQEYIDEAIAKSEWKGIKKSERIVVSDSNDMVACVRDIRRSLYSYLSTIPDGFDAQLRADITGGRKTMSGALTLLMTDFNSDFSYVESDTDSTGIPIPNTERIRTFNEPIKELMIQQARNLATAFNACQFGSAVKFAEELKTNAKSNIALSQDGPGHQISKFYSHLAEIIKAFQEWDLFAYGKALSKFKQAITALQAEKFQNRLFKEVLETFDHCRKHVEILQQEAAALIDFNQGKLDGLNPGVGRAYLLDLLANATRCAERKRYDDAVARLYSLIEKRAKIELGWVGVDNSRVTQEQLNKLPREIKEDMERRYKKLGKCLYELPYQASYRFLEYYDRGNKLAALYRENEEELQKIQFSRNHSLLGHGFDPLTEDKYEKYLKIACNFMNVTPADLYQFPKLDQRRLLVW